ncbi:hypothetical protein RZS08_30760, partial [Arthrospira platensis SPKY1]|nr:hypothetical protein [Arthrospira platensis SPKY1]
MFYFSPFLLFAVPSLLKPLKNRWHRIEGIILCGIVASYTLFAASVVDWQAGWTVGARYYLPILPFLLIALLKYPPRFVSDCPSIKRISTWCEIVFTAFIIWGYIHCFALTLTFPSVPEDFQVP